jgi:hypothetical protein
MTTRAKKYEELYKNNYTITKSKNIKVLRNFNPKISINK